MERNPYFKEWSKAAQPDGYPDEITYSFGLTVEAQITAIQNGQADWTLESPPADRLPEIGTKYAKQVHINPLTAFWYLPMNTQHGAVQQPEGAPGRQLRGRPQRRDQDLRRPEARHALLPGPAAGLPRATSRTARTRRTRARSGRRPTSRRRSSSSRSRAPPGRRWPSSSPDDEVNKAMGVYIQSVLNQIGYKATVKPISGNIFFTYVQNTKNKVQINVQQWYQDYPAASDFLFILFGCESSTPAATRASTSPASATRRSTRRCTGRSQLGIENEAAANALWTKIDRMVTDAAPDGDAVQPEAPRLRLEARRKLHLQQAVLLAGRPGMGASRSICEGRASPRPSRRCR